MEYVDLMEFLDKTGSGEKGKKKPYNSKILEIHEKQDINYPFIEETNEDETIMDFLKKFSHIKTKSGKDESDDENVVDHENVVENNDEDIVENNENVVEHNDEDIVENNENVVEHNDEDIVEHSDENVVDHENEVVEPDENIVDHENEVIEPNIDEILNKVDLEEPLEIIEPGEETIHGNFEKQKPVMDFKKVEDLIKKYKSESIDGSN
jgi:hypothetical protein